MSEAISGWLPVPGYRFAHPGYGPPKNPLANAARLARQRLPGVLAVAGTSVLAFQNPESSGDHSFQDIRMDRSKGRRPVALKEFGQGLSDLKVCGLDPVQDCRRPR